MPLFVVAFSALGSGRSLLISGLVGLFGVFGLLAFGLLGRLVLFTDSVLWGSIKKSLLVVWQLAWSLTLCRQLCRCQSQIESRSWLTESCLLFQVPMVTLAFRINFYYMMATFWVLVGSDISILIGFYGLGPTSLAEIWTLGLGASLVGVSIRFGTSLLNTPALEVSTGPICFLERVGVCL